MPDYQLGKIYKIESYQTNDIYVGSTCEKYLSNRFGSHKSDFKRWKNGKPHYRTSYEIIQYDDAFITLVEAFPCNSKYELEARERHWIEQLDCVNKNVPTRKPKEYYKENKELLYEKQRKYREQNKEKLNEKQREYYELNQQKMYKNQRKYCVSNKVKVRQWHKYYYIGKKIDNMMENVNKINNDIRLKLNTVV